MGSAFISSVAGWGGPDVEEVSAFRREKRRKIERERETAFEVRQELQLSVWRSCSPLTLPGSAKSPLMKAIIRHSNDSGEQQRPETLKEQKNCKHTVHLVLLPGNPDRNPVCDHEKPLFLSHVYQPFKNHPACYPWMDERWINRLTVEGNDRRSLYSGCGCELYLLVPHPQRLKRVELQSQSAIVRVCVGGFQGFTPDENR